MIVLDTHAWLWWVSKPSELSRAARQRIGSETRIGVSAISCLEVATAVAKKRITLDRDPLSWLEQALALQKLDLLPLTPGSPSRQHSWATIFRAILPIVSLLQLRFLNQLR